MFGACPDAFASRANDSLWKALGGQVKGMYSAAQRIAPCKMLESTPDRLRVGVQV